MPTQLQLYNSALRILKSTKLSALSDETEERYTLDDEYSNALAWCLEQGLWNFALRSSQLDASVSVEPEFGFNYAFETPDDFVRLNKIGGDERFYSPYEDDDYVFEQQYILANDDPIYISYVSNGASYGNALNNWPASFQRFVEYELALRAAPHLTAFSANELEYLMKMRDRYMRDARSKDALNQGAMRPPPGRLVRSRRYSSPIGNRSPWWR